jgi:putative transposase
MRVGRSSYYHWLNKSKGNKVVTPKMILFHESREIYGSSRIQKMLEKEDLIYSRSYVGLLMKEMGLRSVLKRKYVITTDSKHAFPTAKNELDRDFTSLQLGYKWVSDITYNRVNDDWNYLNESSWVVFK